LTTTERSCGSIGHALWRRYQQNIVFVRLGELLRAFIGIRGDSATRIVGVNSIVACNDYIIGTQVFGQTTNGAAVFIQSTSGLTLTFARNDESRYPAGCRDEERGDIGFSELETSDGLVGL